MKLNWKRPLQFDQLLELKCGKKNHCVSCRSYEEEVANTAPELREEAWQGVGGLAG